MSFSKPIKKTDEDAKQLIIETLGGQYTGGFDVDSIYHIDGTWYVLEFLKCDTVKPYDSHPNRYWFKNSRKFISLWELKEDLDGKLFLINYEDSRDQFVIIEVKAIDMEKGIVEEEKIKTDFDGFKKFFRDLNLRSLRGEK
jgi:hypothetical protein